MNLLCKLLIWAILCLLAAGAKAESKPPPESSICHNFEDMYDVALAIPFKKDDAVWNTKVEQGRCATLHIEWQYLHTLSVVNDLRVVKLLVLVDGKWLPAYTLFEGKSDLWEIVYRQEFAQLDPEVRKWYQTRTMTEETRKRLGVTYSSCCDHGDVVHTEIRRADIFGKMHWFWLDGEAWKEIPQDIIQFGQFPPGNEPVLFVYNKEPVCFFPPDVGGI